MPGNPRSTVVRLGLRSGERSSARVTQTRFVCRFPLSGLCSLAPRGRRNLGIPCSARRAQGPRLRWDSGSLTNLFAGMTTAWPALIPHHFFKKNKPSCLTRLGGAGILSLLFTPATRVQVDLRSILDEAATPPK